MPFPITRSVLLAALLLVGCNDQDRLVERPAPATLDREAVGHYCSMIVADHGGPKAHIFVGGQSKPYWFTSVRDAFAFTYLPGEPKNISAIYVNDTARATAAEPDYDTWVEARDAWFVVGSDMVGGMGAPETAPFADQTTAEAFAAARGGTVVRFDEVPQDAVLGAVEMAGSPGADDVAGVVQ